MQSTRRPRTLDRRGGVSVGAAIGPAAPVVPPQAAHIAYAHGGEILLAGTPGLGSEVDVSLPLCPRRRS